MSAKTGNISLAETPEAIARCHAVMRELRPQFDDEAKFVARVTQQISEGYHLAYVESEGLVRSCAGYRFTRTLSWGFHLYVDDLITRAMDRDGGFGSQLFDWLIAEARHRGCESFHLDSGVQRFGAHRFYLHKRMDIVAHHFSLGLDS